MTIATTSTLTNSETTMLALAGLTAAFVFIIVIYRAITGHAREDFMTPAEVRRTYFPTDEEVEEDAEYIPTPEERQSNRKGWTVAIIGMVIIGAMMLYLTSGH